VKENKTAGGTRHDTAEKTGFGAVSVSKALEPTGWPVGDQDHVCYP